MKGFTYFPRIEESVNKATRALGGLDTVVDTARDVLGPEDGMPFDYETSSDDLDLDLSGWNQGDQGPKDINSNVGGIESDASSVEAEKATLLSFSTLGKKIVAGHDSVVTFIGMNCRNLRDGMVKYHVPEVLAAGAIATAAYILIEQGLYGEGIAALSGLFVAFGISFIANKNVEKLTDKKNKPQMYATWMAHEAALAVTAGCIGFAVQDRVKEAIAEGLSSALATDDIASIILMFGTKEGLIEAMIAKYPKEKLLESLQKAFPEGMITQEMIDAIPADVTAQDAARTLMEGLSPEDIAKASISEFSKGVAAAIAITAALLVVTLILKVEEAVEAKCFKSELIKDVMGKESDVDKIKRSAALEVIFSVVTLGLRSFMPMIGVFLTKGAAKSIIAKQDAVEEKREKGEEVEDAKLRPSDYIKVAAKVAVFSYVMSPTSQGISDTVEKATAVKAIGQVVSGIAGDAIMQVSGKVIDKTVKAVEEAAKIRRENDEGRGGRGR